MKIALLVQCCLTITLVQYAATDDPCTNAMKDDDWQRSTGYIIPKNSPTMKCDRPFVAGWYRFTSGAGGEMATKCPPERSCGTNAPIWLDGTNPTNVNEEKTLKACVRYGKSCCASSWSVKVRKCAENNNKHFLVYRLEAARGCPMSYCAGSGTKCPPGEVSKTGFTPCSSKYPKLRKGPNVSVGVANSRMRFSCKFDPRDRGEKVRHEVVWYTSPPSKVVKKEILKGDQIEAFLQNINDYGEEPTFCLNRNIYCEVKSYFEGSQDKNTVKSDEFYAGFKINPKTLTLSENGRPQKVTIETTVPVVCQDGSVNCEVRLEIGQTKQDNFVDYCTLKFKPGPAGQEKELEVVAKRDFVDDGDQTMKVKLFVPHHLNPVDWNCYKNITDITVKTKDVKTARCTSTGDPHLTTFDRTYYNHFHVGDYVYTESKARLFKVHVRTFRCGRVSCNCGVAAREGDDVIVVDMCRDNVPRARYASTIEPQKGTSIERSANGKVFIINFPSGAFVKVEAHRWGRRLHYANIIVQLPSDDYGKTQGLCGTWDGNKGNDLMSKTGQIFGTGRGRVAETGFTESWKLSRDESLFYCVGGERKCLAERAKSYCTCSETCCDAKRRINCDFEGYSERPKYIQKYKGYKKLDFPGAEHCGRKRRRRSIEDTIVLPDDGETAIYDYNPKDVPGNVPDFPTESGTTKQKAATECEKSLRNSQSGKICLQTVKDFDFKDIKDQCILDVQVLDDIKTASETAVASMAAACEEITLREMNKYWKKDASGSLEPPKEIGDSDCPNECSGSGRCMNATCVCDKGFISSDCSIKEGEAPILIHVPFNGLCDIRKQDCVRTRVVGYNFIDSSNLACRTTEVIISEQPYVKTSIVKVGKSQLLSFAELSCELPKIPVNIQYGSAPGKPVGGFLIQLSNDGSSFSHNSSLFTVYDSTCMECTTSGARTCKWKANSCKINNYCFGPGDSNPKDWCQVCDPSRSNSTFVKRLVNNAPVLKTPTAPIQIFKGQKWRYELKAIDADKQPISFTIIGETYGMKISSAGVLMWFPQKVNKTYTVTVNASDPCGKSTTGQLKVETKQCICEGENGGICELKMNSQTNKLQGVCKCPEGCQGAKCTDAIDGRICKVKVAKQSEDDDDENSTTTIVVVVVLVFIALIIAIVIVLYKKGVILNNGTKASSSTSAGEGGGGRFVPKAVQDYEDHLEARKNNTYTME